MTTRGSATRYARALLDVAIKESIPEQAERDLIRFADLLAEHSQLHSVLVHPAIPSARKRALTEVLSSRLALSTPVTKLLLMLAERDRLTLVPELVAVYRERLMDHQLVVQAEITTAEPLSADREAQLQDRLSRATGRRVTLRATVDPAIIGGVIARIGTIVYDGSIAAQLMKMRHRLEGA